VAHAGLKGYLKLLTVGVLPASGIIVLDNRWGTYLLLPTA